MARYDIGDKVLLVNGNIVTITDICSTIANEEIYASRNIPIPVKMIIKKVIEEE